MNRSNRPRVRSFTDRRGSTRLYHYYKRQRFPVLRLPGRPGEAIFEAAYARAEACQTGEDFARLRAELGMQPKARSPADQSKREATDAIMAWAEKGPLTWRQVEIISRRLGMSADEIIRDRLILR